MPGEDTAQQAHTMVTVVNARLEAHEKICTERYGRISSDTNEIKQAIQCLATDLKGSVQRIHERIDSEAGDARNAMATTAKEAAEGLGGLKVWVLSGGGSILLAVVAWFADHFFGKPTP